MRTKVETQGSVAVHVLAAKVSEKSAFILHAAWHEAYVTHSAGVV